MTRGKQRTRTSYNSLSTFIQFCLLWARVQRKLILSTWSCVDAWHYGVWMHFRLSLSLSAYLCRFFSRVFANLKRLSRPRSYRHPLVCTREWERQRERETFLSVVRYLVPSLYIIRALVAVVFASALRLLLFVSLSFFFLLEFVPPCAAAATAVVFFFSSIPRRGEQSVARRRPRERNVAVKEASLLRRVYSSFVFGCFSTRTTLFAPSHRRGI